MESQYDVLVLGSGTAGQTAALELSNHGFKIGLVESDRRPGGTCALRGCQAKKWFYELTELAAKSNHLAGVGVASPPRIDWPQALAAKNRFTDRVPARTVRSLEKAGVDYIEGRAGFVDERTVAVGGRSISARYIILAVGARPMHLNLNGAEAMIDNSGFLDLDRIPERIVFIGGGFISFEFAHFAARLGPEGVQCTILEAGPRPLGPFDREMVELLTEASAAEGIAVHSDVRITGISKQGRGYVVNTEDGRAFEADLVVHGAGRTPDLEDLNLDRAGVEHGRRGVAVNRNLETTNPAVYAVGDCAATVQLARVADAEAKTAALNILQKLNQAPADRSMDYGAVPAVLFTYPQYGMVGETEDQLIDRGAKYEKRFAKELAWPTYQRVGLKTAAYKLLIGEDGLFLGAHIISDNATGLINTFSLAMINRIPMARLYEQSVMTPYPSRESDIIYMIKP